EEIPGPFCLGLKDRGRRGVNPRPRSTRLAAVVGRPSASLRAGSRMLRIRSPALGALGNGAPGTIRTSDPQIRSLMLYPAELRARAGASLRGRGRRTQPPLADDQDCIAS